MASWQYAWLTDQPYTTIGFSHPQPGLAAELAGVLGVGVFMPQSTEWSISLDRSRVNLGYVSGLLGDRGWEMFAVETRLQPGAMTPSQLQTNWYFKRPGSDKPASTAMNTTSSMSSSPVATPPATAPAAAPATLATPAPATPAWSPAPTPEPSPAATSWQSAPMAPETPAAAPSAPEPPAPEGPEQAPMGGSSTPPPGPQG